MTKKIIVTIAVFTAMLLAPRASYAQYGEEPVLGAKYPEDVIIHEPIEAGIADNPAILGAVMLMASGALTYISKKTKASLILN